MKQFLKVKDMLADILKVALQRLDGRHLGLERSHLGLEGSQLGLDLGQNVSIHPVFCLDERGSDEIDSAAAVLIQLGQPRPAQSLEPELSAEHEELTPVADNPVSSVVIKDHAGTGAADSPRSSTAARCCPSKSRRTTIGGSSVEAACPSSTGTLPTDTRFASHSEGKLRPNCSRRKDANSRVRSPCNCCKNRLRDGGSSRGSPHKTFSAWGKAERSTSWATPRNAKTLRSNAWGSWATDS